MKKQKDKKVAWILKTREGRTWIVIARDEEGALKRFQKYCESVNLEINWKWADVKIDGLGDIIEVQKTDSIFQVWQ